MTRLEFGKAVLPLAAAFDRELTRERIEIDYAAIGHFPDEAIKAAVQRAVLEHEYPTLPPTALLLRYADEAAHGVEMTSDQAVSLVWDAVKKHGGYDADCHRAAIADLGPKICEAMKAAGGYQRFCDCGSSDKGTLNAQFREAWNASVRREEQTRRLPAALVPRVNGPNQQPRIETPLTPRLVAQGANS